MAHHYRYWAFISYSHRDRQVAGRLHARIEGYRMPRRLVGLDGPRGPVPERLKPVFRDHDELEAGGHLGPRVRQALEVSRSLVVLCSPAAALSHWVDAEVAEFERLQPGAPLFCVILEGEPLAGDARECLPPSLRARFAHAPALEQASPIAVDLRPGGDGWVRAVRMIAAGLAGLPLDQLVQREAQRRYRRAAWATAALAIVAVALGMLAFFAARARDEARRQRAQAEGLVEFMLVDLRKRLEPHGRLDALDAVGARVLRYYDAQPARALGPDALGQRARALHLIGEISDRRGDTRKARAAFARARSTTAELLARDPDDPQRLYDHAQSVYWTGYIDWQYGDFASAERALVEYGRLTRELSARDPDNPDWLAELGYAHSNLGTLLMEQGRAREAVPEFLQSLKINQRRATMPGDLPSVRLEIAQDHSWLSSAYFANGQLRRAMAEREAELQIYRQLLAVAPDDAQVREASMFAHRAMGKLALASGDLHRAQGELDASIALARIQRTVDPRNVAWQQSLASALIGSARLARLRGDHRHAHEQLAAARAIVDGYLARDAQNLSWRLDLQESLALEQAALLLREGRLDEAQRLLDGSQQRLQVLAADPASRFRVLGPMVDAAFLRAQLAVHRNERDAMRRSLRDIADLAAPARTRLEPPARCRLAAAERALARSGAGVSAELLDPEVCEFMDDSWPRAAMN